MLFLFVVISVITSKNRINIINVEMII